LQEYGLKRLGPDIFKKVEYDARQTVIKETDLQWSQMFGGKLAKPVPGKDGSWVTGKEYNCIGVKASNYYMPEGTLSHDGPGGGKWILMDKSLAVTEYCGETKAHCVCASGFRESHKKQVLGEYALTDVQARYSNGSCTLAFDAALGKWAVELPHDLEAAKKIKLDGRSYFWSKKELEAKLNSKLTGKDPALIKSQIEKEWEQGEVPGKYYHAKKLNPLTATFTGLEAKPVTFVAIGSDANGTSKYVRGCRGSEISDSARYGGATIHTRVYWFCLAA